MVFVPCTHTILSRNRNEDSDLFPSSLPSPVLCEATVLFFFSIFLRLSLFMANVCILMHRYIYHGNSERIMRCPFFNEENEMSGKQFSSIFILCT